MTGSGDISSRVARGSTLIERQPAVRLPVGALPVQGCRPARMKTAKGRPPPRDLRSWRIIIMRSKGEHIGTVEAQPDRESADAVAIKQFDLDQDHVGPGSRGDGSWSASGSKPRKQREAPPRFPSQRGKGARQAGRGLVVRPSTGRASAILPRLGSLSVRFATRSSKKALRAVASKSTIELSQQKPVVSNLPKR